MTHLDFLESESIHIIREVVAEFEKPAMLYSVGKDSSVMLHLLQKAFYPAVPPLPLVHVDTTWKFKEMIEFRDKRAKELGMELIVYQNPKIKDVGGKIKCRKRKIKCRIFATNYLSFNLKLKL